VTTIEYLEIMQQKATKKEVVEYIREAKRKERGTKGHASNQVIECCRTISREAG
jgi:hypothetical protein